MKTKYLLPNSWRPYGWLSLVFFLPILLFYWFGWDENFLRRAVDPLFSISHESLKKLPFLIENRDNKTGWDQSFLDEILYVGVLSGLLIVGFSKFKVEDERIAMIRLEALQWGVYANYLALILAIIFVYDGNFLVAMVGSMFTPLIIFVLRLYWFLREKPAAEGADV